MKEALVADSFIYARLSADEELNALVDGRIFQDLAFGDALPVVVFTVTSDIDVVSATGDRIMAEASYVVKALVAGGSYAPAQDIANRIDAVLHHSSGPAEGGEVFSCIRTEMLRYTETVNGQQVRHLGGSFRVQIQALATASN